MVKIVHDELTQLMGEIAEIDLKESRWQLF